MTPGRGSLRAMWVDREHPKYRAVYDSLPHDRRWRTTAELFVLARQNISVRETDMTGLITSMRKHGLAQSQLVGKKMQHRLLSPEQ